MATENHDYPLDDDDSDNDRFKIDPIEPWPDPPDWESDTSEGPSEETSSSR